ncbi:MAG: GPR endopeptidase [Christensenellaceae bacterium]|jgi:spore protease|nr:GPR endopeptidase [Christensenellaceae bacterium]
MRYYDNLYIENGTLNNISASVNTTRFAVGDITYQRAECAEGTYFTIELPTVLFLNKELQFRTVKVLGQILDSLFKRFKVKKSDHVMVIGIGNDGLTSDALGVRSLMDLEITEHLHKKGINRKNGRLSGFSSGVSGVTGLSSFEIIRAVTSDLKPSLLILVDTLATKKILRLQKTIQVSDIGLTPGSGVNNNQTRLSKDTLGIQTITIGVPLVIYVKHILMDYIGNEHLENERIASELDSLVVTLKEIDIAVNDFSRVIALAINHAVHGN